MRRAPAHVYWLAIGAGLLVFGYAGWDSALWDPRWQVLLHLVGLGAFGGLIAIALRGGELPRTRIDLPLLGLLAAYALATMSAENAGLALRAMASVTAFAAMLPVALVVLRHHAAVAALVITIPTLLLAAGGVIVQLARRVEWYVAGAPGLLPPLRLTGEGTPFGSVAVPPFVLLAIVPLTFLIEPPRVRRGAQLFLVALAVPVTLLSGSRSAWLAIAAAAAALIVALVARRRLRPSWPARWGARQVAAAVGASAVGLVALALVAPRLTAVTSLIYRGNLWTDTLAAWSTDPLLGIGPGTMPFARQAAAEPLSFPVRQPHSHNVALGVLGDTGLVGLAVAIVLALVVLWFAGPWRARGPAGLTAGAALVGLAVGGLFEDLTFLPNFNLLLIACVAVALADASNVTWGRLRMDRPRLAVAGAGALGALVLLGAMVSGDAAAVAYRAAADAVERGAWTEATTLFRRSAELDPWHPATPKALAVAADAAGQPVLARRAAERAVELNAGDGASWANLALLCLDDGDHDCAAEAAQRATDVATLFGREAVNAALVHEALGDHGAADDAYRLSLAISRLTTLATTWPRTLDAGSVDVGELGGQATELNRLLAARAAGAEVDPDGFDDAAVRALAAAMAGDDERAGAEAERAIAAQPESLLGWEVAILIRAQRGEPYDDLARAYAAVRGAPLPDPGSPPSAGALTPDIASFRSYPIDGLLRGAEHLQPPLDWPWALEDLLP